MTDTKNMKTTIKRERWYGSVVEYLNIKAAEMLAAGKITKAEHDMIVAENIRQAVRK
jgi:hypothetical protein